MHRKKEEIKGEYCPFKLNAGTQVNTAVIYLIYLNTKCYRLFKHRIKKQHKNVFWDVGTI